ncbi:MCE family protein [Nocardioides stalactiti]|uniref:MCE family protein n=1 Tax=Nocardioides stalactiti TaxID=2755356 RepID=UPI00248331B3|nr:MCE family protein [Nocardioides stalactiti]
MRTRNYPLVGAIGIVTLALMVVAGLSASRIHGLFGQTEVIVELAHAAGLKAGDPVRMSGVKIGSVKDIDLAETVVEVTLEVKDEIELGDQTRASLKVETLLGTEYIALTSAGSGELKDGRIPIERTEVPFDLQAVLGGLTERIQDIDTDAVAESFRAVAEVLDGASPQVRRALDGVASLSQIVSRYDGELQELTGESAAITRILADRSQTIGLLVRDAGTFLTVLEQRRVVIERLLGAAHRLSSEIVASVQSTRDDLGPALRQLQTTVVTLRRNKGDLEESVRLYAPLLRYYTTVLGNGRWFEAGLFGLTPQVFPDAPSQNGDE